MHKSQNFMVAGSQNWLFYPTKSLQKELEFSMQNCGTAQFLKFLVRAQGKTAQNGPKSAIFQNCLITHPKVVNA